ncbi:MAG TPA: protein kinase [Thermoanaerobaculia bacterium]|nr:protein kinase [Thermoanaerobaculia bacterium]
MSVHKTLGHYEILRPIGAGGMGEVYIAHDPKLGRKVAIKMLPVRLTTDRETLTRFTQEARSASALNHPNIVTIHEVGASEGTPYIVMEYIEGEDFRTIIQRGPLPILPVLDLATQIADGLAAAHERGIVHRDLKPENIMVTRDGFVKILDFGLAKVIAPAGDETENTLQLELPGTTPGTILGTVGYMSPEQATGRRLDFRSDQFAFGAILYELITGKPAFEGETAIDTLSAILHNEPPPVLRTAVRMPVQLSDMVKRLLSKAADERYSSPRDLARELHLLRDRVSAEESGYHQSGASLVKPERFPRVAVIAAVALTVLLAALIFIVRETTRPTHPTVETVAPTPPDTKFLAVTHFKDLTGDATGQLVVDGFAETLTARLANYPAVQVVRPSAAQAEIGDVRKVARQLGANMVLSGSMMREGERIRVTYSILQPASGKEERGLVEGSVSNLFGVQDDVADDVARKLNLGRSTVRVALDPAVSQRKYLEALGHLRRQDRTASLDAAITILEGLGPSPTVQAALARAYLSKFLATREPQLAASANAAADRALAADPQSIDVNITLGDLHRETGRFKEAIDAFLRVLSQQPANVDAVLGLAATYDAAGDIMNAENTYKRAIALQPNYWSSYNRLGAFYSGQSRYEDAIPQFQKVAQLVPDNEWAYNNLGATYQLLGRYDQALSVFTASVQRNPTSQGFSNLGTCYYFLNRFPEAAAAFAKAAELTPLASRYWRNLGDAYRWIPGREADAKRAFLRAIDLCDEAIRINATDFMAHRTRAVALAKLGRDREARAAILRALELKPQNQSNAYEAAVIANIDGSEDEAVARIEQALRLRCIPDDFRRDPEFANLRKSGRLDAIIREFGSSVQNK